MALAGPTFSNEIEIVSNTATAINSALSARNSDGWTLSNLVDKPSSNEVYLIYTKVETTTT